MEALIKGIGIIVLVVGFVVLYGILLAWPVMWLINQLFPTSLIMAVFGIPYMTFWKALALNVLCGMLFKSTCSSDSK
jgi:hypothetical protein